MQGRILYTECKQCEKEDLESCHHTKTKTLYKLLKNQEGILCFKCERGHNNCVAVEELGFEKLISYSIDNVSDRYYRGAIFNFAAALESFFGFMIEILAIEHGLTNEEYNGLKKLLRYSERQFGAFCTIYYYRFKERPFSWNTIEDKSIIRNKVIHQGDFPTRDEIYRYGNFVLEHIYKIMVKITNNVDPQLISKYIKDKYNEKLENVPTENTNIIKIQNSLISLKTTSMEDEKRKVLLQKYSCSHEEKYMEMVQKAQEENKILDIDNNNELILVDKDDSGENIIEAEYIGPKSVDELLQNRISIKKVHKLQDLGLDDNIRVVSLIDD